MKYLTLSLLLVMAITQADDRSVSINRLEKGEYYYHYLNGDFPTAMNQLEQWRNTNEALADEASIMEAAMLLSLGLHGSAHTSFQNIEQSGTSRASARSWFYLARRYFELAEFDRVLESLDQASGRNLDAKLVPEALYMKVSALLELGLLKKAQLVLDNMPRADIWTGYARHNFILAMMEGNTSGRGFELLVEDATFYIPDNQEGKNLKDRINLIAGLNYLDNGKNRAAEKHLKKISLAGPYTHAALLQYGWSRVEQWQYEEALQPWRELQVRFNQFDPEVMESMVGVPHVLELMNAQTQALKTYQVMEGRFLAMDEKLQTLQQQLDSGEWINAWALAQNNQDWGWRSDADDQVSLDESSAALKNFLRQDKYVSQLSQHRDLWVLQRYLADKEHALGLWNTLVKNRRKNAGNSDAQNRLDQFAQVLKQAKQEKLYLQEQLQRIGSERFVLPDQLQQNQVRQIGQASKNIESLMAGNNKNRKLDEYQQRWRRVQGLLAWQMNESRPAREWQLKKELHQLSNLIKSAERQLIEAKVAKIWAPGSWRGLESRIAALSAQVKALRMGADELVQQSREALVASAAEYVQKERARIREYLGQTRLSIARLYDDALQARIASGELGGRDE